MINYSIAMRANPLKPEEAKKAYAQAQINGEVTLKELSRQAASQTTVSRADVSAVLIATVENLLCNLADGKQVDFGELGKFRLQVSSNGAVNAEKFTSDNITGVSVQFVPGEELKNVFTGLEFTPVATRAAQKAVLKAEKAGQTTVELKKAPAAGGN